ncbi:Uncharacterised protein [Sphingobacterium multivorum]|uniref:Uncharacterized protein n=1 Tax=Sphingobacterium multivorum TaxID=28454 RepID=A0A2X2JIT3_SPHMU|nr:Uncharacterised protein [Sphingobacterium multivorum]
MNGLKTRLLFIRIAVFYVSYFRCRNIGVLIRVPGMVLLIILLHIEIQVQLQEGVYLLYKVTSPQI